jgi:y4mF family transcriptional regulator
MLPKGCIMTGFPETATERLLREERERQKLFDGFSNLRPKIGRVGQVLEEAKRPLKTQQRLLDVVAPFRHAQETLADVINVPERPGHGLAEQFVRHRNSALSSNFSNSDSYPASKASLPSPVHANPQGSLTSAADIGILIRKARKTLKLSQTDFAAHAGVGRRFVSELEAGKPSLEFDKVLACAAAAGIDITARPRRAG